MVVRGCPWTVPCPAPSADMASPARYLDPHQPPRKPSNAKADRHGLHRASAVSCDLAPPKGVELSVLGAGIHQDNPPFAESPEKQEQPEHARRPSKLVPQNSRQAAAARELRIRERMEAKKRSRSWCLCPQPFHPAHATVAVALGTGAFVQR